MLFQERADRAPHHCVVFPHLGAAHRKGYLVMPHVIAGWDPAVQVSVEAVEQMAQKVGYPTREEHDALKRDLEQTRRDLVLAREQLAEADEELGAIHVLKGRGYAAARRPGRPPSKKAA